MEISTDGQTLYWSAADDTVTHVHALNLSAGDRDTVLTVSGDAIAFETDSQTDAIYWLQNGSIRRKPLADGSPETLLENLEAPTRLTLDVDANEIYWISDGTVYRADADGSAMESLGSGAPNKAVLDIPNQRYYWTQADSLIKRASIGGSNEKIVAEKPASPHTNLNPHAIKQLHLDTESNILYWRGAGEILPANIWRKPLTQDTIETALIGFAAPAGLTVDPGGKHLYWTAGQGKLLRANLDGSDAEEIAQVACGIGHLTDIAFDSERDRLYWGHITDCPSYDIYRSDLTGDDLEIVEAFNQPWGLALDAPKGELYWTEHAPYVLERSHIDTLFETKGHEDVADEIHPWGVGINAETGRVYWSDPYASAITSADPGGEHREELITGLREPRDLSLDVSGGAMYWIEQGSGTIQTAALDGSNPRTLFSGLKSPEYMAMTLATTDALGTNRPDHLPRKIRLRKNYPNPFNPSTTLRYELPRPTDVDLHVFDLMGRKVATLVDRPQPAGLHSVTFDGSDLPSGLYLYRLETPSQTITRQMVLVK